MKILAYHFMGLCLLFSLLGIACAGDLELDRDYKAVRSQLQSMGHGYYSEQEWVAAFAQLDAIAVEANELKRPDMVVESALLKAQALSDMQGEHDEAMELLEALKNHYRDVGPNNMKKIYVLQAELFAKQGDAVAISRLINEFERSPFYDGEHYAFSGGTRGDRALAVVRPNARGSNSITVTAMKKAMESARMAPGRLPPQIHARDSSGAPVTLADYSGQVILLDFWLSKWKPWVRELPGLVAVYDRYHPQGFEVLGFSQDRNKMEAQDLLTQYKATWPQLTANARMWKDFGIYGEARNILIDRNGIIIGSDLHGAELADMVRRALGRIQ